MEFNFNINNYFKDEITKIGSRLIPDGFIGDRREVQDCLSKISYILTILGEKSAKAQGLQKVITSGEKLRNSEHIVYILIDPKGGTKGLGTVLGMLKMGVKHLYVFDAGGNNHEVTTKCILDFYVHESKQRMGLGKKLFQYMLQEERVDPVHLAIDKPSSKFLSFLGKHYGLEKVIPQMNNFVVFEGFFSNRQCGEEKGSEAKQKIFPAGGVSSRGGRISSESGGYISTSSRKPNHYQSASTVNINNVSYYGRPAPHKPITTMGLILQHKPSPSQQQPQNGSPIPTIEVLSSKTGIDSNKEEKIKMPPFYQEFENNEKGIIISPSLTEIESSLKEKLNVIADKETEELKNNVQEDKEYKSTKKTVFQADSFVKPVIALETPMNHKTRFNNQGYLDLKFYHSSLW